MAAQIVMPKFGFSMEIGVLDAWLVKVGDHVKRNDPLAEITSEKLTNTANSTIDGVVAKLLMKEGDEAPCGALIAIIAEEGEDIDSIEVPADTAAEEAAPAAQEAPAADKNVTPRAQVLADKKGVDTAGIEGTGPNGAVTIDDVREAGKAPAAPAAAGPQKLTPKALKYAEEHDLDYTGVVGTGRLGMVTIDDLKKNAVKRSAAPAPAAAPAAAPVADGEAIPMTQMQKAIFKGMYSSIQGSAQLTNMMDADLASLKKLYYELKGKYAAAGIKLTYTAMLVKAAAMALEEHPDIRTQVVDDAHVRVVNNIDIGVAVDIEGGLIVPVIREANLKDLRTICRDLADITARARNNQLTADDMGNAVMTISNVGTFGVRYFTPILNAPESVILGVGAMTDTPVVVDGGIFVHPLMGLSLTYDHRVINGAPAARFLTKIKKNLEDFRWV